MNLDTSRRPPITGSHAFHFRRVQERRRKLMREEAARRQAVWAIFWFLAGFVVLALAISVMKG